MRDRIAAKPIWNKDLIFFRMGEQISALYLRRLAALIGERREARGVHYLQRLRAQAEDVINDDDSGRGNRRTGLV